MFGRDGEVLGIRRRRRAGERDRNRVCFIWIGTEAVEVEITDYQWALGEPALLNTPLACFLLIIRLNEIIHGKRSVTPDTAIRLERALGMTAQFWLNLQLDVDLFDAHHSPAAKEIRKIKPIKIPTA